MLMFDVNYIMIIRQVHALNPGILWYTGALCKIEITVLT